VAPAEISAVPSLVVEATAAQVRALSARPDVAGLFLYEPEGIDELANSMRVARVSPPSDETDGRAFTASPREQFARFPIREGDRDARRILCDDPIGGTLCVTIQSGVAPRCACSGALPFQTGDGDPSCSAPECRAWPQVHVQRESYI
jgi:hypothetical protein